MAMMMEILTQTPSKIYKNRNADERQKELYKKFPSTSFLGNEKNVDHVLQWNTFFRRNLHRVAIDYLGIKLHPYQALTLYLMGVCQLIVIIACRAAAKSFIIALFSCCKCITFPHSKIVLSSATKGQSKLIISEKIRNELMDMSPMLRQEIVKIKDNQNEVIVYFRSGSTIVVVPASENGRGRRSSVVIREEFRQIEKNIDDSILSPFQTVRQAPYLIDPYYGGIEELQEDPMDIYISSSWFDPHWMWGIVDKAYDRMLKETGGCLLAFDESITLKHGIRKQSQMRNERSKQDPITWRLEFMNERLKENRASFFTYNMLKQNQVCKQPFYPRTDLDVRSGRKNPYAISKVPGEIRIISCDMAFIENSNNDNSVFTCMRFLPESTSHKSESGGEITFDTGYRIIVCYMESVQGGEIKKQATRIRELFEDFGADYICLDTRNSGVAIFDSLARTLFDEDRNIEYSALTCMNDEGLANRIKVEGAEPRIYAINASQKLNSDIALNFRRRLAENKIDFLVNFETAKEEILPKIKEYMCAEDADMAIMYERPFLETQALFAETAELMYEKKTDGVIVIREQGKNRKDRYTSVSYGTYLCSILERDLLTNNDDYEYSVFIN